MLRWKVVECKQRIEILRELLDGFRIFRCVYINKLIECGDRVSARCGVPDSTSVALAVPCCDLSIALKTFPAFMEPATLMPSPRKHLFKRCPQPHRAVADREQRRCLQTMRFQVQ
ncbi:hypothetical protein WK57_19040 [Burkholderia ubonensis]|uniref:Uncharacterized protein n=1 Tax=Burkholderia ubonensis TaxID=101571 RepID=A0A119FGZ9_9BURK|nr:hypothetical protein WL16_17700 [Burkholderia ubonensis]KWA80402.1 hypothetical protein WL29_29905 [Burkholderia ubonensis]KWB95245.1 hypothetical protein WL43_32320 [Burkholderia ubonensis]KWZ58540.1 hypothetical protein WK57_19040 [Burkholderia ubonensis]